VQQFSFWQRPHVSASPSQLGGRGALSPPASASPSPGHGEDVPPVALLPELPVEPPVCAPPEPVCAPPEPVCAPPEAGASLEPAALLPASDDVPAFAPSLVPVPPEFPPLFEPDAPAPRPLAALSPASPPEPLRPSLSRERSLPQLDTRATTKPTRNTHAISAVNHELRSLRSTRIHRRSRALRRRERPYHERPTSSSLGRLLAALRGVGCRFRSGGREDGVAIEGAVRRDDRARSRM
jgi:hypothetical protein